LTQPPLFCIGAFVEKLPENLRDEEKQENLRQQLRDFNLRKKEKA
jgi:predicted DNA binding CopG/RHH family protein